MNIKEIDKSLYRQRLNHVIVGFIAMLSLLALLYGSALIAIFSLVEPSFVNNVSETKNSETSNFKYNFVGVLLALLSCGMLLNSLKKKEFFDEIYYVWQIKQIQNQIYRKLNNIKKSVYEEDNIDAMIILHYYYTTLKQIYLLDDNTLTLSTLNKNMERLNDTLTNKNIVVCTEQFNKEMITSF